MKKRASKRLKRQDIIVPPSPYGFEETVKRLLKVKPEPKPPKRRGN